MPPFHQFFDPVRFSTELVYTTIILVLCFVIYFKTKDMYELTKYKGIHYFRNAFLFFGFAYLIRFFLHLMMISRMTFDFFIPMREINPILIAGTGYLSTMAIFYLVYSTVWKKIKANHFLVYSNIIAVLISFISFAYRSHFILISLQLILLLAAVILSFRNHSQHKKTSHIKTLYILILIFWLVNLFLIGPGMGGRRSFLLFEVQMTLQVLSLAVFFTIYYKVSKWVK